MAKVLTLVQLLAEASIKAAKGLRGEAECGCLKVGVLARVTVLAPAKQRTFWG